MSCLSLYLFGSPKIEKDGSPVEIDTRKAVALLAYLAITGVSHRRETLAALLWPDYDQSHAMGALRRTLSAVRKSLGGDCLEIHRETVGVNPAADLWVDVTEFHRLLAACGTHGHSSSQVCSLCLPILEQALKLYRNDFMAGFTLRDSPEFDDWEFFQSDDLRRKLASLLERLVQGYAAQKEYEKAIGVAKRQIALDPLHEPAHRQLMQLYIWAGQRNAALRQYQECERILKEQLGVEPLEETTRLYQVIKEQRSDGLVESYTLQIVEAAPAPTTLYFPMVGREEEMASLLRAYQLVKENGYFMVVEGEAGIGKTRLVEEFLSDLRMRDAVKITARCYPGQANLAYGPFAEGLRNAIKQGTRSNWQVDISDLWVNEAARLLPELSRPGGGATSSSSLGSPGAQTRFYEGLSQVLLALCGKEPPGVLFFDDVQWADEGTLDLLTYLVRRLRERPLFILATWTPEDMPAGHRLRHLLTEAMRNSIAGAISLTRLTPESVKNLVMSAARGIDVSMMEFSERLYRESEGLPFFVVEYLTTLPGELDLKPDEPWSMPASVREVLRSRLDLVGETGRQLLQTAAVIGRSFDFDTLREVSGRTDDESVTTLEILIGRGLIRERQPGKVDNGSESLRSLNYDFNHDKVRSFVYAETSLTRRRLLHQRVAQVLAAHAHGKQELNAIAGQIAYHYKLGGRAQEAAEYYKLAGDHAHTVHANTEALANYQTALGLGYSDTASLVEAIGDMHVLLGEYSSALRDYETAAALHQDHLQDLARIEHKLGDLFHRMGDWELAESHFQAAVEILKENGDSPLLSHLYADWSQTANRQQQPERARQMASEALRLAEAASDAKALAQAHNVIGILARRQGDLQEAIRHLEESLAIAEKCTEVMGRISALNNLSLAYADCNDLETAISKAQQALDLCVSLGDRHREAALRNNLADLYHASGQKQEAMAQLTQAVSIFAEIGAIEDERVHPEIWKLTEW
jgi:predicted ATPase/DNA-binding SARP family transcriptional activator